MSPARHHCQRGVAAMEFILALPVLLIILIGLYNLASMTATITSLGSAANFTAELISRNDTTIDAALIDDYIAGARIVMRSSNLKGIDVYGYGASPSNTGQIKWKRGSAGRTVSCSAALDNVPIVADPASTSDPVGKLLSNGSDAILVRVCATFTWPITRFLTLPGGAASRTLERQIIVGPRQSPTLTCTGC